MTHFYKYAPITRNIFALQSQSSTTLQLIPITSISNPKTAAYSTELTVKVVEKEGYKLKELKANDADITTSRKFTVTKMTVVTAIFESKQEDNKKPDGVKDALLASISVTPNPFSAQLRILNPEDITARYELVNASGMVVHSGALSGREEIVDTVALTAEVYFVRLEAQNGAQKTRWY